MSWHGRHLSPERRALIESALRAGEHVHHIAGRLGSSDGTVRKIRQSLGIDALPRWSDQSAATATPEEHRHITRLKDEITALKTQVRDAHREALDEERIARILGVMADWRTQPPGWLITPPPRQKSRTPEVPVMMFSDWHYGEVVHASEMRGINAYNPDIARARVRRVVQSILRIARDYGPGKYPGAVVNLAGDFISGALHDELMKSDALEPLPCVFEVVDMLADALRALADQFGKLYVPCVYGNHGRTTKRIEFKREHAHSLDWMIYQILAREFRGDKRITIAAPPEGEVSYRVFNRRYLLMHGHTLGVKGGDGIIGALGPIARGEVKVGKQQAAINADYDLLLLGHWHQMLWLPKVIVASSLKGWDDYARKALRAPPGPPTQPLWFVHPRYGETSRWEIHGETGEAAAREWVSIESVRRAA